MQTAEQVLDRIAWPTEDNRVPREIYRDEDLYALEMDRIFAGPFWMVVAHESEIPELGDYKTMLLGQIPIIVTRDMDGEVRVLVNACAHRGTKLLLQPYGNVGKSKCLTCIYHNWRYSLDGKLLAATMPEDFPVDFDKEAYGLPKARVAIHKGAVFATFSDDAPSFADYVGAIAQGLDRALGDGNLELLGAQKVIVEANWKICSENLYDGYHTVSLHKAFRMLKMKAAGGEQVFSEDYERDGHVWNEYRTADPEEAKLLNDTSLLDVRTKASPEHRILNVWPVSVISDQVDTLAIRYMIPRGPDRTEVHYTVFGHAGESAELKRHRTVQGSNLFGPEGFISLEDQTALQRVHASADARGDNIVLKGTLKRFPPYRIIDEAGLRHFYSAYRRAMGFRTVEEVPQGEAHGTPTAEVA
ncbi:MAG: Anthranilate 1,2-dioxygenase large subunit [Conexibacter sp.]|nr:Anthranilate 1,2-dioxygenase large subunit [Conexibacter sp.]